MDGQTRLVFLSRCSIRLIKKGSRAKGVYVIEPYSFSMPCNYSVLCAYVCVWGGGRTPRDFLVNLKSESDISRSFQEAVHKKSKRIN